MQSCSLIISSESEFEGLYQQEISNEDKVYISAVITRLRRILNWNPNDEKRIFEKKWAPQVIREILSQFFIWKEFVGRSDAPDTQRIQHLVIFSLAKLSLYCWITDSRMVAEILREVYECDGHFSSMFAHVVNRHDGRSLLLQKLDYSRQREDSATIFFLHHAQKTRLQFNGVRFLDLRLRFPLNIPPVFLAAIYNKPHMLLHLLRYGARVELLPNRLPDDWNLPMLLRHLIRILWNSLGEDLQYLDNFSSDDTSVMSNTIHQAAECLRILLRVIPQIQMGEMNFLLMKFERGVLSGSVHSHDFIRQLSERNIVPKLINRYLEASDLSHQCRCVIRNSLNTTWNLPYGITLLPVPKFVKNYLSILVD